MKRKLVIVFLSVFIALAICYFALVTFQNSLINSALKSANAKNEVGSVNISLFNSEIEDLKLVINDDFDLTVKKLSLSHDFIFKCLLCKTFVLEKLEFEDAVLTQKNQKKEIAQADFEPISVEQLLAYEVKSPQISATQNVEIKEETKELANSSNLELAPEQKIALPQKNKAEKKSNFFSNFAIKIKNIEGEFKANLTNSVVLSAKLNNHHTARNLELYNLYKLASLEMHLPVTIQRNNTLLNSNIAVLALGNEKSSNISTSFSLNEKVIFKSQVKVSDFYKNFETQAQILLDSTDLVTLFEDLPEFSLNLHATANFDADFKNLNCKTSFRADAKNLQEISVYLDEVKTASLAGELEFKKEKSKFNVNKANFGLNINEENICTLKNTNAFTLNTANLAEIPDGKLFKFSLNKFNLNHLNAFAKQGGVEFSSAPISAELLIAKSQNFVEVKTEKLISIKNFSFKRDGILILDEATFNIFLNGNTDFNNTNLTAQFTPLNNTSNFATTLEASVFKGFEKANIAIEAEGNPSSIFPQAKICGVEKLSISALATLNKNLARLKKFTVNLYGKENQNLLTSNIKNEICFDLTKSKISTKDAEIKISSTDLPKELLKAFYPNADAQKIAFNANVKLLNIDNIEAELEANVQRLSLKNAEETLLENLTFEASSKAILKDKILDFDVSSFRIIENATGILTGKANVKFNANSLAKFALKNAEIDFSTSLPKLLKQPIFKRFDNASSGMLEAKISAQNLNEVNADIILSNLSMRGLANVIEKAELKNILRLENHSISELKSKLRIASTRGETLIDADLKVGDELILNLNSQKIILEDFKTINTSFENKLPVQNEKGKTKLLRPKEVRSAKELPSANQIRTKAKHKLLPHESDLDFRSSMICEAPPAHSATREVMETKSTSAIPNPQVEFIAVKIEELPQEPEAKRAVWDFNKNAKISISAKQIFKDGALLFENLNAEILSNKNSIKVPSATALFYGAPSSLNCDINFTQDGIYKLENSKLKIQNLEIQNLLKKNGEGNAFLEGKFDIDGEFFASSKNLNNLPRLIQFNASAKTSGGKMHILDKTSDTWEVASLGAGFLKLGGTLLGGKVKEISDLTDILDLLATIEFSDATLNFRRGEDLNIALEPSTIKAQDALLSIKGALSYIEGESFLTMPLYIPIKLDATSGKLAYLLQKAGYQKSESGVVSGPEFQITGTLSKTKNNLREILSKALRSIFK